jgi:hypothetical protein
MKFTKAVKEKVWQIVSSGIGEYPVDYLEARGYKIVRKRGSYNTKTRRYNFGKQPDGWDSIFFLLGVGRFPTDLRIKYYLELPVDLAEKILILEHLPDIRLEVVLGLEGN